MRTPRVKGIEAAVAKLKEDPDQPVTAEIDGLIVEMRYKGRDPAEHRQAMKVVGKRKIGKTTPEDADRLLRTAWAVRQTDKLVPKGLYRFRTFQEAEEWMTRMMASTYVRLRSKTSSASVEPSTKAPPSTS